MALLTTDELVQRLSREPALATLSANQRHKTLMRYHPGLDYYTQWLRALGIVNLDTVLDAGCGYGQWAVAAALLNRRVMTIDHNPRGFPILRAVMQYLGIDNIVPLQGSVEDLPVAAATADAVLSMEVLTFVGEQRTVGEMARVCKPGGKIVLLTTGAGYFLEYLCAALQYLDRHTFATYLGYLGRTLLWNTLQLGGRVNLMFQTPGQVRRLLQRQGLRDITFQPLSLTPGSWSERPLRPAHFLGLHSWFAFVARRADTPVPSEEAPRVSYHPTLWRYIDYPVGLLFCLIAIPFFGLPKALWRRCSRGPAPAPWLATIQDPTEPPALYYRLQRRMRRFLGRLQ